MRLKNGTDLAEVSEVRRLSDRLLSMLGESSIDVASIALLETNVRLLKSVNHYSSVKACDDLIHVLMLMKSSEGNTHGNV